MAITFPTSLDTFTNPTSGQAQNAPSHSSQHADANDAIEALEAKVGIDGSAVTTSHDYKLSGITGAAKAASTANFTGTSSGTNTGDQTNITGNAATVTTNANLTGPVTSVGNATTIAAGVVTEAMQVLADNTTQDVSTTKHGYAPKAPNDATKFLNGVGAWAIPAGGIGGSSGSTDNALIRADGTGGSTVQGSGTTAALDDNGLITLTGASAGLTLATAGAGIKVKTGTNATKGVATLSSGTVTVSTTKTPAAGGIFLTQQTGTPATIGVSARNAGTDFTITSANVFSSDDVAWLIIADA